MQELYDKLKKYSIDDAIKIEESDRQYIALKKMWDNINPSHSLSQGERDNSKIYLSLILANSIICYQLSWKWENYWEEFSDYFLPPPKPLFIKEGGLVEYIINSLWNFIKKSKNNKRFVDTKVNRLEKLKPFLEEFILNPEYYYDNMEELRDKLAKAMKQKHDAKTIVFAIKMFSYWARNVYDRLNYFPENISIPIDSRLINLYEKYKSTFEENLTPPPAGTPLEKGRNNESEIKKFYFDLSKKLQISELHLDALVWVNYDDLIK